MRRYPNGWGEAAPLTGLMYCADCGGKMYVHRVNNGKRVNQYTCAEYSKVPVGTRCLTQHRIKEADVLTLIQDLLKAIAEYARFDRDEFLRISAQDTISYQRMWPDGICRVTDTRYTRTIRYQDINYQLNQDEDKDAIFRAWCDFLNYFDSSIHVQLSFLNLSTTRDTYAESVSIPTQNDAFNHLRTEYTTMLQNQLAKGNNGLVKTKYLTFGIDADSIRAAKPRLERIETDVLNNFKRLGVKAEPMNGAERLEVMHSIFHMDTLEPFSFSWDWLPPSGLSTKDFIAPSSFEFANGRMFRVGRKFGCVSFVQILAPELSDRMLADFLDMESSLLVMTHEEYGQVRIIHEDDTFLFWGTDIATALGYSNPQKALRDHCKGRTIRSVLTNGGKQNSIFITEGDVYRLVIGSKLPAAEKFEHWVFDEVLPSIRKHGGYIRDDLLQAAMRDPSVLLRLAQALVEESRRNDALAAENAVLGEKAVFFDAFVDPQSYHLELNNAGLLPEVYRLPPFRHGSPAAQRHHLLRAWAVDHRETKAPRQEL